MTKVHKIKLEFAFCDDVMSGRKNFEVRKNDRGYQLGDRIKFVPVLDGVKAYHDVITKTYEITYILSAWGIQEGYVVFGIKEVMQNE